MVRLTKWTGLTSVLLKWYRRARMGFAERLNKYHLELNWTEQNSIDINANFMQGRHGLGGRGCYGGKPLSPPPPLPMPLDANLRPCLKDIALQGDRGTEVLELFCSPVGNTARETHQSQFQDLYLFSNGTILLYWRGGKRTNLRPFSSSF